MTSLSTSSLWLIAPVIATELGKYLIPSMWDLGQGWSEDDNSTSRSRDAAWANIVFPLLYFSSKKLPWSSRSSSLTSHHCHRRQRNDWTTTCPSPPAARSAGSSRSNRVAEIASRGEVEEQPSLEVADRDDLLQGAGDGVVQLLHDGRLPLQVLADVGVLDLVKCHHVQQPGSRRQRALCQGWLACSCRLNWKKIIF